MGIFNKKILDENKITIIDFMITLQNNFIIKQPKIIVEICLYFQGNTSEEYSNCIKIKQDAENQLLKFNKEQLYQFRIYEYGVLGNTEYNLMQDTQNCLIVDPAGSAFASGQTIYTGDGASGAIYKYFDIADKQHTLGNINAGECRYNNLETLTYEERKGALGIIHAVGPSSETDTKEKRLETLKK
jgi:hypothetical protein